MHTYAFEKLQVWQEARSLTVSMYHLTTHFPPEEKFGMVSQIRRASLSIASNIAEGSARKSAKDQANFYQMAYSGAIESLNQFIISFDLGYVTSEQLNENRLKIETISNKINSLRNSVLHQQPNP
jgi:four helix bundle protein